MASKSKNQLSLIRKTDELIKNNDPYRYRKSDKVKGLTKDVIVEAEGKKVDYSKQDPLNIKKKQTNKKTTKSREVQRVEKKTQQKQFAKQLKNEIQQNTKRGYAITDSNRIMQNFANKTGSYDATDYARKTYGTYQLPKKQESLGKKATRLAVSVPVAMADFAKGAVFNTGEAVVDFAKRGDYFNNWLFNKLGVMSDQERLEADWKVDDFVKRDLSGEMMRNLGWDEENERVLKDYSYLTGNTKADKFIESLGEQVPTYMMGYAGSQYMTGGKGAEAAIKSLKGLKGTELIKTAVGNVGKASLLNSGSNIPIALTSYNSGFEEALRNGATRDQARRYAIANAATEIATEWTTGGIPGLENSTGLLSKKAGDLLDATTGNIKNEYLKPIARSLLKYTGGAAGEGFEEALSEIISPYIKNATYTEGEKVNWNEVTEAALMGMASAGIFSFGQNLSEMAGEIKTVKQKNQVIKQIEQVSNIQVQELQEGVQNGDITPEEGTQAIEYIKAAAENRINQINQSYENRNNPNAERNSLNRELAQQQVQIIEQQVRNRQITPQEGTQRINEIQNYLRAIESNQTAPTTNETQQSNVIGQQQQNITQNANNEVVQNQQQSSNLVQDYMNDNYGSLVGDYIDENYEGIEEPTNVGKHYGDLGKAHDTNYFSINGSRRGTGHFGNGTYFVSNDYEVGPNSTYAKRPVNTASFDGYNLATPKTAQDGFDLHDALKEINYNNTPISKELYDKLLPYYEASFGTTNSMLDEESFNDYKNIRNLLKQAGVETEEFNGDSYSRYERDLEDKITDVLNNYDRFSRAEKDLKRILNINDKQLNNALEAVRNAKQKYDNYNDDQKLKADSLSTIFMKKLGFDGVDVRHLKELNDTEFGSVIYDLKPNQQNKQQESNLVEDYMNNGEDNLVNDYMNNYENGNMVENYMNAQNEVKSKNKSSNMFSTVAPYYSKQVNDTNYQDVKQGIETKFNENAQKIANNLGIKIDNIQDNVGGYDFDDGKGHVDEISYTYQLGENTSKEDAKMFGCLLGDVGNEIQESIIVGNYTNSDNSDANLEYTLKLDSDNGIIELLKEAGIKNYTFNKSTNELQLLLFKDEDGNFNEQEIIDKFEKLAEKLGGRVSEPTKTYIESELVESEDRQNLYETWLESNRETKNRELYNQVQQAYEKVKEFNDNQGTSDSSFSNEMNQEKLDALTNKMRENRQQRETKAAEEKKAVAEIKGNNVTTAKTYTKDFQDAQTGKLDKKKLRKYVTTSNEATGMQKSIDKADLDRLTYETQSNDSTYKKARKNLEGLSYEDRLSRSRNLLSSDKRVTAVDVAEAQITLLEAAQSGRVQDYLDLQQDLAIMGTEAGQTIQAMSMIQKMSPDGQLQTLLKIIDRQQKLGNKNYDNVKLNENLVQEVLDSYDDVNHTTFNKEKLDNAMDALKQDVADQMKVSWAEKANEWRYLSMLGNPKTHIRNMLGNFAMSFVKSVKDYQSAAAQDLLGRLGVIDKSNKTATLKWAGKDVKKLAKEYSDAFIKADNDGSKYSEKANIEQQRRIFKPGLVEWFRKTNLKALNVEDNWFKNFNYRKSFSSFLTAKGIRTEADIKANPQIVQDANNYAILQAKVATFQQDNKVANWIRQADKLGKGAEVVRGAIIPFTSVPMNIAQTGIEYTPGLGMFKTISDFKKAAPGDKAITLIDGIAKQTTGSSLALIGYALAKAGYVTADAGDDNEDKFEKDIGAKMNYSIKFGDKSYDLSWLSPSSMPFFVGASMFEQLEKDQGVSGNLITQALASTLDPLSEMSVISSFFNVLDSYEKDAAGKIMKAGESTLQNYVSQYIPTLFSQTAKMLDDKKRDTYASKNSPWAFGEETLKQLAYKIPGARNLFLPEQKDFLGRTKKESYISDNKIVNAFEAFFSPINVRKDTSDEVTRELIDIYNKTGGDGLIPNKSAYTEYFKYKNKKYDLSKKEYNEFKEDAGEIATKEIEKLINDSDYKELSDDKKAKALKNVMGYSRYKAKYDYFEDKGIDYYNQTFNTVREGIKNGEYSLSDYYLDKQSENNKRYKALEKKGVDAETFDAFREFASRAKADKTKNGGYVRNSKKKKIINYIEGLNLSKEGKEALYKDYKDNQRTFTTYK